MIIHVVAVLSLAILCMVWVWIQGASGDYERAGRCGGCDGRGECGKTTCDNTDIHA